ncbi:MAG TPA: hypothetical protein VHL53_08930 [Acidimicrobiia bacterium]|nr:hypothetical protein [Acidimicrobiia bacterium]
MDLAPYVDALSSQLAAAAEAAGSEARDLVERLAPPLEAAIRLTLQDALAGAAEELTLELAPGSVELRIRGREPEFVVTLPPAGLTPADPAPPRSSPPPPRPASGEDDGGMSRINLRLPDHLKGRVEAADAGEGLSVNTWLVRAASTALDRPDPGPRRDPRRVQAGSQRYTGWAR